MSDRIHNFSAGPAVLPEEVIRKMVEAARTGRMGDGKIFVLSAQSYEAVLGGK